MNSPGWIDAAEPRTVTRSRWPRTLTRRTQKPVSGLWKVTRSTRPGQEGVDLWNREASDPDIEVEIRGQQCPQLRGEEVLIPARIECQFVVGKHIGALLRLA